LLFLHTGEVNKYDNIPYKHFTVKEALTHGVGEVDNIYTIFRNPLDRMLSLYSFYKQIYFTQGLEKNQPEVYKIVKHCGFNEFIKELQHLPVHYHWVDYDYFVCIDGKVPENLTWLWFEELQDSFEYLLEVFGVDRNDARKIELPHIFKSKHIDYKKAYSEQSIEIVRSMFPFAFDGMYC
jgi:hypothetical protein